MTRSQLVEGLRIKLETVSKRAGNRPKRSTSDGKRMKKKIFLSVVATLILASVHLAEAQQAKKVPKIGILYPGLSGPSPQVEGFRQGLRDLGYAEGKNITIEYRFAEGKVDRLPDLAAE